MFTNCVVSWWSDSLPFWKHLSTEKSVASVAARLTTIVIRDDDGDMVEYIVSVWTM